MDEASLVWTKVASRTLGAPDLWRAKVPGGWLVAHPNALTFMPDAEHAWSASEASGETDSPRHALSNNAPPVAPTTAIKTQRSDKVVASPAPGVATTEAELEAFRVVEELCTMHDAAPDPSRLSYTDTESFFVVHLGSPLSWALRIAFVASDDSWVSFNLSKEEAARLAPNVRFLEPGFGGDVRARCDHPDDLRTLAPLVVAALSAA